MKFSHIALSATLSILALTTSLVPARAAQIDDVLKRLEALEQENASLRNRLQRVEGQRKVETAAPHATKGTQAAAATASPAAAYNAIPYKAAPMAAPAFSWTGFYVGGHIGGGWQTSRIEDPTGIFVGGGFVPPLSLELPPIRNIHSHGFLGGGQAGWNYQVGQLVVGVEANGTWSDINGSRTDTLTGTSTGVSGFFPPILPVTQTGTLARTWQSDTDWIATAATRFGFAWDRWLVYTKGGIAGARFKYGLTSVDTTTTTTGAVTTVGTATTIASGSDTRIGFLFGVGGEWAFWNNWSAFLEYNYMGFGDAPVALAGQTVVTGFGTTPFVDTNNIEQRIQTVKFGVNLRFAPPSASP